MVRKQPYGIDWRDPARTPTYDLRRAPEDYQVLMHQHAEGDLGSPDWASIPKVHPVTAHPIGPLYDEVKNWEFDDRMNEDPEYVNALAVAIKEGHPLPPAVIGHLGADQKGVVDGRHRILAAKKAGLTHVPVIDLDHSTWQDARKPGWMAKSADELRPLAKMALIHNDPAKPMLVWRVQDQHGLGPYQAAAALEDGLVPGDPSNQPEPDRDFTARELKVGRIPAHGTYGYGQAVFGFESPKHAVRWFGDIGGRGGANALKWMGDQGFSLVQVPASKVWRSKSGRQVMFVPHPSDPGIRRVEEARVQGYVDDLSKAIRDIEPGRLSSGTETWDYSHLLTPEQRAMDYRLRVKYDEPRGAIYSTVHRGGSEAFGGVKGVLLPTSAEDRGRPIGYGQHKNRRKPGGVLEPHAYLGLPGPMKKKGFGRAMYEALYAHAMKKHGVKTVQGGYHTAAARRVHESLARRHGLDYNPEPGFESEPGEGLRGGPYEYMLKGEVPMSKALAEVPAGQKLDDYRWDYSHLLAPEQRDEGYQLHVTVPHVDDPRDSSVNGLLIHRGEDVGHVFGIGDPKDKILFVEESGVQPAHRRKGLGKALYEAMMTHALKERGYERVEGDVHSTRAHQAHMSIGRKHGMDYRAEKMRDARPHDYDDAYGPYSYMLKSENSGEPQNGECPKCGGVHVKMALIGEPVFVCKDCDHKWPVERDVAKAEQTPAFERPTWVEDPELPARIQRIYDAVRSNLTQDLLKPEYRGNANPFHGHCYVATEALWHLLDGKKTGWERMHLATPQGPHWFLQHRKTGVILDPTAEQFPSRPDYEKARAKGFTVGPPDYNPDVPSKRAQVLIDRVKPSLRKAEDEAELADLAKSVGFIKFPKLGVEDVQEPMTYPAGHGFLKRGKKGRAIFSARHQLANASREEGAYALPSGQIIGGAIQPDPAMRQRGADKYDVLKERGHGAFGGGRVYTVGPTPHPERSATGYAMGGKVHGLVGIRAHEAQHSVFGQVAQMYGDEARKQAIEHVISKLSPMGLEAGKMVMGTSGYTFGLDPEEFITSHQQFLTDEKSRKSIYRSLGITDVEEQRTFFKLMRQNFEQMRHAAALVTPRMLQAPRLKGKVGGKLRKSEDDLQKSIAAIPKGIALAYNPLTNESMYDFSHVLSPQLRNEGWKLRIHHTPRIGYLTARAYDPQGISRGSVSTYHRIESGVPILGVDTAYVQPEHRRKGLGIALYEASYAFGRNHLRLKKVVGDEHSKLAASVHRKLAAKHGLHYEPDPYASDGEPASPAAGPYEYMLKGEVGLENSDIGTTLADGTEVTKGMVKSEDWSPADWEEQAAVLMKAAKALPGQLGLPGLGDEVFDPVEYDRRMEAERQQHQQEYERLVAAGQLPRERWGATWTDRVTKGQLQPGEAEDIIRRLTQPVPHPDGARALSTAPIWEDSSREDRPALSAGNIDHFLTHHWDRMTPEQRAQVVASPHGDVSDWLHTNHNRLSDEEFKRLIPTLSSKHFWSEEGQLPEHRVQAMLDYAKATPRPEGEVPTDMDPEEAQESWLAWKMPWSTVTDTLRYSPISGDMAMKILREYPKDHPEYREAMGQVADNPRLSDEQRGQLLDEIERQQKEGVTSYQQDNMLRGVLAHAHDDSLQLRAALMAMRLTQHYALGEGVRHNKNLSPRVVRLIRDNGPRGALVQALQNPAFPVEMFGELSKLKDGDVSRVVRRLVAEHPAAPPDLVREMAESDRHRVVRQAAQKALEWHDPSSVHPEHVDVRFNTGKLRQLRDLITSQGKESMSPKELPPGDWKAVRDEKGDVSVKKIDEFIEKQPATTFGVSEGMWRGAQRHSRERSYVFQLNLSTDQVKKLKEAGAWETFRRMHNASARSNHPVGHAGLGWVRWTGDEHGIHIDEVQSDLGQSFVKQAANQARMQGRDEGEAASAAEREYPEAHYQKIKDIVFGGKHPSEVLTEAFLQYLRNGKGHDKTGYNRHTGTTFHYGGRPSYVGTPIHIWQPQSKATISLRHADDKPLPGHFQVGYRDVPQKRLGMKPAKYGELKTQTSKKHAGKATWGDTLRKREPGAYVILGKVGG